MATVMSNVVFLDRDGVINREGRSYVTCWEEFEFLPRSIEAIKRLTENGFPIILITNQSIVNRNMISRKALERIHLNMKDAITAKGGRIKDILFCPHRPEDGCGCRKPKPGMILAAQKKYNIDLSSAVVVGDREKDIACARNAGCARAVLVKSGNGDYTGITPGRGSIEPDHLAEDLYDAVTWILSHDRTCGPSPNRP